MVETDRKRYVRRGPYRAGVAIVVITSLLIVWTTIVRDDGNGMAFFELFMAAGVGGFAARFAADGMARAMIGVAAMQVLLALAVATAPITAAVPGESTRALVFGAVFAALWLVAAACFRAAARAARVSVAA